MGMAQHPAGHGVFTARAMLSLEPATVSERRYPLLFQQGETAYGKPIVDGDRVAAEFWTAMSNRDGEPEETLAGCFIARLDATDGRCTHFRQYFSEFEGHPSPFEGWGE